MLVTIVAKTRMGGGACIGGITGDGRSVRLIAPDMGFNDHFNNEYEVGDVWEVEADPPSEIKPPHTENIHVRTSHRVGRNENPIELIRMHMTPRDGGIEELYGGMVQGKPGGPLYIAASTGVPSFSTMFWCPDRDLVRDVNGKRIRYRYPTGDGGRTLTFVGFQEPPKVIPAGTLLRVSLAHWWRPVEYPEVELRCYLQLSGWFGLQEVQDGRSTPHLVSNNADPGDEFHADGVALDISEPVKSFEDARHTLKRVFGYDEFRPLQADIIANVLNRRDSLAVMPTGSGKSMCFQLPALLFPGLTVVVSPLISLMEDQVLQLREIGVAAEYLNSTLSYDRYVAISGQVKNGRVKLLYTSPETLLRPETLVMLGQCRVDCLTIDEAHCISEWGHDFRPEYRQLVQVRRQFPNAVCLTVTATATERVRRDIKDTLGIREADEFVSSFDRENLFLSVLPREDGVAQVVAFLKDHAGESGLIYCTTRAQVDALTEQLASRGWPAIPYHAGLDYATRRENQRRFAHEEAMIVVATIAFGMGINKSNVRFVIHHDLPKDLENYYQQIGRAGRDGLPADCLLLFSRKDAVTLNFLADRDAPSQRAAAAARLQAMIAFAETNDCRRRPLLSYFGEIDVPGSCGRCDNCLAGDREVVDLTIPAQKFLSCALRTRELFGATYLIDILRGSNRKEIIDRRHNHLSTYNIGREFSKKEWQQLARQFVSNGLLVQEMDHGSLKLTPTGRAVLKGETFLGSAPTAGNIVRHVDKRIDYDTELFNRLRQLRAELAHEANVPPYVIFSDASLRDMSIYYPQTNDSFIQMHGVGLIKLERYGQPFLSLIQEYCREKGFTEEKKPVTSTHSQAQPYRSSPRRDVVLDLYSRGLRLNEIADTLGIKQQSACNYLWEHLMMGGLFDVRSIQVDLAQIPSMQKEIFEVFDQVGTGRLRPVYDALQESASYELLHMQRLVYLVTQLANGAISNKEILARISAAGETGDSSRLPELIVLLHHNDGNVRRLAASALGKLGDTRATSALMGLLSREGKPQVRQYAVIALGRIGDPAAEPLLKSIEADQQEMPYTREAAGEAIRQILDHASTSRHALT